MIDDPKRIFIDSTNDRLIVMNRGNNLITFYDDFSTLSGQSGIAPSFTFDNTTSLINDPYDMILLPNGSLLVSNNGGSTLSRFDAPLTNNMAPSVSLALAEPPAGICYDAATDRFAVTQSDNENASADFVLIFNGATTFTGAATPFATLDSDSFISNPEEGCFFSKNGHFFVYTDDNGVGDQNAAMLAFNSNTLANKVMPLGNLGAALYKEITRAVEVGDRLFIADRCEMEEFSPDDEDACFPLRAYDYNQTTQSYSVFPDAAYVGFWSMVDEPRDMVATAGSLFTLSDEMEMALGWKDALAMKGVVGAGQGGGTVGVPDYYAVPFNPDGNSACTVKSLAASSR